MDKTHVKAYFSISGENFPIDYITDKLLINPTEFYCKGDIVNKELMIERKETCWEIGTDYQESYDIMEQIEQVLDVLENKKDILTKLSQEFELTYMFTVVICVREGLGPAIYLNHRIVNYAASINAEIHLDVYDFK